MTKKKSAEAPLEPTVVEPQAPAAEAPAAAPKAETIDATANGKGRLERIRVAAEKRLGDAKANVTARLEGTRAKKVLDEVPARVEKELDAVLDRIGLVRKSKLQAQPEATARVQGEAHASA